MTSLHSNTTTPSRSEAPTRDTRLFLFAAEAPREYLVESRPLAADAPTASSAASMHGTIGPGHLVQELHAAPLCLSNTISSGSKLAVQPENKYPDREWSASDTTNSFLPAPLQSGAQSRTHPGASSETGVQQTEKDGMLSGSTIVPSEPKPLLTGSSETRTHHEQTWGMSPRRAHIDDSSRDATRTNAPSEAPLVAAPMPLESMSATEARPTGIQGAPEFMEIPETQPRAQPARVEFSTSTEEKVTTILPTASSRLEKEQADPLSGYRRYLAQREAEHDLQVEDALEQLDQEWIQVRHARSHAIESLVPVGLALEQIIARHRANRTALERASHLQLEALVARLDQVDKAVSELARAASRLVEVARPNSNGALRAHRLVRQIHQYQQQIQEACRASQMLTQQAAQIEARRELHERMINQLVYQTKPVAVSAILPPGPAPDATPLYSLSKTLSPNTEWRAALEKSHDQARRHVHSETCARIGIWWPPDQQLCIRFAQALWQQAALRDENEFVLRSDAGTLQLSTVLQDVDGLLVLLPAQSTYLDTLPAEAVAVIGNQASCRNTPLLVLLVDDADDAPRGTQPGIVLVYENREHSFACFCVSIDHAGDSSSVWSWFADKLRSGRHHGFETPMLPLSIILLQLSDHPPTGAPTVDPAIHDEPRPWSATAARWTSWVLKIRSLATNSTTTTSSSSCVDQFTHIANVTEQCVARLVQATTKDPLRVLPVQRLPAWIAQQLEELDATSILVPSNLWPDAVGYSHRSPTNDLGESEWIATWNSSGERTPAAAASTPPLRWQQLQQKVWDEMQSLNALKQRLLETLNQSESKQRPRAA
ncbi:hypothetical protein F1559_002253 [Cyanidiococcus yangmingshanensis]|uniref:Uncharacterized protein n=1 Tax=Cyanidiococcus yangmingshanensis TaxID=2690220 RepID=A0A7J7ICR1_9RHOD|nr:hypothetical protein F1559_002253 [Cyanidiococcus yangmingshanensis]